MYSKSIGSTACCFNSIKRMFITLFSCCVSAIVDMYNYVFLFVLRILLPK
ncbi:hypothetical protein ECH_0241 [Ehrlichia chaffeensis str. Arkansas]|uniref:Uncharacterized protein n=1 Tax=Ehrlichia chaffeensis (strain ATCC CRL-10679 / Arkansas) TaxID=205920 RepID=Q2GHM1_EHRCR|nr:hypothetical protein ECH_0241 [Ehrlichia chaffeensis str. Arkansas]